MVDRWIQSYLVHQRFSTAELTAAIGVPGPRFADWLKRGVFQPLTEMSTGTGRSREFVLADVYRAAMVAALTDEDGPFAMPVFRAVQIVDWALGLRVESYFDPFRGSPNQSEMVATSKAALLDGLLPGEMTCRDATDQPVVLVGGWIDRVDPPARHLAGAFSRPEYAASALPNPLRRPPRYIVLEVTSIFAGVDERLLSNRGLSEMIVRNHADG